MHVDDGAKIQKQINMYWEPHEQEHIKHVYEVKEFVDYKPRTIGVFVDLNDAKSCESYYKNSQVVIEYKKKMALVVLSRYDHCPSVKLPIDGKGKNLPLWLNGFEWNVYINIGTADYPYGKRKLVGHESYEAAVKHINELGYEVTNENTSEALMEATMLHCLEHKDELDNLGLDHEKYYNKSYQSNK